MPACIQLLCEVSFCSFESGMYAAAWKHAIYAETGVVLMQRGRRTRRKLQAAAQYSNTIRPQASRHVVDVPHLSKRTCGGMGCHALLFIRAA